MRCLKQDAKHEKVLQALEDFMSENKISLSYGCNGFIIVIENKTYNVCDIENHTECQHLPRTFDSERMIVD
jgi:hypothetical protein